MADICTDNRFELIEKYKKNLIESTNIETSQDEMAVLDNLLFRLWQMGWLDRLEEPERKTGKWTPKENRPKQEVFICSECGGWAYSPWIGSRKTPKPNKCKYSYCPNCGAEMDF